MLVALGLVLAGLVTMVVAAAHATRATPEWFRPLDGDDPTIDADAEAFENAVVTQLSNMRPRRAVEPGETTTRWESEPWSVSVSQHDANAWVAARLPRWLRHQHGEGAWPEELRDVQIAFREGEVEIAGRIVEGTQRQVLGATLRPRIEPKGDLWAPASRFTLGRLPVPAGWVISESAADLVPGDVLRHPESRRVLAVLRGEIPAFENAVVRLDDGRHVRLLGIRSRDGRVELTFRTER